MNRRGISWSTYFLFLSFFGISVLGTLGLQSSTKRKTNHTRAHNFGPIATQQIESFRNGDGLLMNIHITHHGGTSVCAELGKTLTAPSFACLGAEKDNVTQDYPHYRPWPHNMTATNLAIVHQYFQFISWEFNRPRHYVCMTFDPLRGTGLHLFLF